MKRRAFITLLGGAAAWPLAARAQQTVPLVGFVWTGDTSSAPMPYVTAFRQGLKEVGFVEGENVTVEYRWPGSQYDRLPGFDRRASAEAGDRDCREYPSGDGGKSGNLDDSNCVAGVDPVTRGLVTSFNRPRRQCDRRELFKHCIGGEATGLAA